MAKPLFAALLLSLAAACAHPSKDAPHEAHGHAAHPTMRHVIESKHGFEQTLALLQQTLQEKGMTVFAVIDHQEAAQKNGLAMQSAKVIIFGNPKAGTPLMLKDPAFALQLPLRVLVTETEGKVQVVFNDTKSLIQGSKIEYAEVEQTLAKAEQLIRATVGR